MVVELLTRTNCSFAGMNFLAHAYLSFDYPEILVGNMISDFVKGSARFGFSGKIGEGIWLHREIDAFTDTHEATRKAKQVFRPAYRLYSGAIMDVIYDHFLANDASIFTEESLKTFTTGVYQHLEARTHELPANFQQVFGHMRSFDWLYGYRSRQGIQNSLKGLVRRSAYLTEADTAFLLFTEHYEELKASYEEFFPDVKQFAKHRIENLVL